jgi:hypothetical protein
VLQWGHNLNISLSVPGPRTGIHLADWDGDGKCDVLVQNKASGALTLYRNDWQSGRDTITFTNRGVVAETGCNQGWGVGIFDRGMRIADIEYVHFKLLTKSPHSWHTNLKSYPSSRTVSFISQWRWTSRSHLHRDEWANDCVA